MRNYNHNIIREKIEKELHFVCEKITAVQHTIEQKLAAEFNYAEVKPFYDELNALNIKKKKILLVLEKNLYGIRKKVRPRYHLVLLHSVKNHIINLNNKVLCGKTAFANDQVFNKTRSLNWTYYHANVIGGGLIAMMEPEDVRGNTLACLYSKYLKKNGGAQGTSVKTRAIRKGSKKGSFIFLEKQTVTAFEYLRVNFYKDKDNFKIYVGFEAFLDPDTCSFLKGFNRTTFLICPRKKEVMKYFDVNNTYGDLRIVNMDILDVLVPELYTLKAVAK